MNQEMSASMISSASAIEREVNLISHLIHQSAKEEAEEEKVQQTTSTLKRNNMSFDRYVR
jgi:hypothetical protein